MQYANSIPFSATLDRGGEMRRALGFLVVALLFGMGAERAQTRAVERALATGDRLMDGLTREMAAPERYMSDVREQTKAFPEGRLFPVVMPTLALLNVVSADPSRREEALALVEPLMQPMLDDLTDVVSPPHEDLLRLEHTMGQGTWIGQSALALGAYRRLGGTQHQEVHDHLVRLVAEAFDDRAGGPIESYPGLTWAFDSVPAALALRLHDEAAGSAVHDARIAAHLRWILEEGKDPKTGLPASVLTLREGSWKVVDGPRGCELMLRIGLLAQIDREAAWAVYQPVANELWRSGPVIGGFAEWPGRRQGFGDFDSGPVVLGRGSVASGFGLGAARAVGDRRRHDVLAAELATVTWLLPPVVPVLSSLPGLGGTPLESRWHTGFLFGDAALAWSVTWADWGVSRSLSPRA